LRRPDRAYGCRLPRPVHERRPRVAPDEPASRSSWRQPEQRRDAVAPAVRSHAGVRLRAACKPYCPSAVRPAFETADVHRHAIAAHCDHDVRAALASRERVAPPRRAELPRASARQEPQQRREARFEPALLRRAARAPADEQVRNAPARLRHAPDSPHVQQRVRARAPRVLRWKACAPATGSTLAAAEPERTEL